MIFDSISKEVHEIVGKFTDQQTEIMEVLGSVAKTLEEIRDILVKSNELLNSEKVSVENITQTLKTIDSNITKEGKKKK